jgi:hypothetical protein
MKRPSHAAVKPRLRFDKVVLELIARLKASLDASVPHGMTVVFTCTAPIRLSGKTAVALSDRIVAALARDARRDLSATIHDNAVRVRFVAARIKGAAKVLGFVHNPDPGAATALLDMTQALIETLSAAKPKDGRTLTIETPGPPAGKVWDQVYAALEAPIRSESVVMIFADATTQTLSGDGAGTGT